MFLEPYEVVYHATRTRIFFPIFFAKRHQTYMGYRQARNYSRHQEVLAMLYDADVMEEIYDASYVESSLDDDEINSAEAGFMHGYLGNWKGF